MSVAMVRGAMVKAGGQGFARYLVFALALCSLLAYSVGSSPGLASSTSAAVSRPEPDIAAILKHVEALSSLGSRLTGYEGCRLAAGYIASVLRGYGLEVRLHNYTVVVPVDKGSELIIEFRNGTKLALKAHALWPNGVNPSPTPPGGLEGPLLYAGTGSLSEFNGKPVKGSIVLMEYESGSNWLNAAKLGAKAVVFIGPEKVPPYFEALAKFLDTPLNFPRLYVPSSYGALLRRAAEEGATAVVVSRIAWEVVEATNVIGVLRGAVNDAILVTAHYDSWSVVPALASSAHEALAPAFLLELARILSAQRPYRTVWFVFFSGHWQALAGAREFVETYYFGPEVESGAFKPVMLINVGDLDPRGFGLQLLRGGSGTFYATTGNAGGITLRYAWVLRKILDYLADPALRSLIANMTGLDPSSYVRDFFTNDMYWGTEQYPYMLDSEPAEMTRGVSFTIQTAFASKQWLGSPVSDLEDLKQRAHALRPQLLVITHIVSSFVNEKEWGYRWDEVSPSRLYIVPGGFSQYAGFITLKGKVIQYNFSSGWYSPVPRALVRVYLGFHSGSFYFPFPYPFNKIVAFADEKGEFEVHGLAPYPFIPGFGAVGGGLVRSMYVADAWVVNQTTGEILYAPDLGLYGSKALPPRVSPLSHPDYITVVVNRFNTIVLFDLVNPKEGRPAAIPDPRIVTYGDSPSFFLALGGVLQVQDFETRGEPLVYGAYYNGYETVGLAFFMPRSRAAVLFRVGGLAKPVGGRPTIVLVNASRESPEGSGIGESWVVEFSALRYAQDLLLLTKHRYEGLESRGVRSASAEEKIRIAESLLVNATASLERMEYDKAHALAMAAWSVACSAYEEVMSLIDDSSRTGLFFFTLIVASAVFLERLLLHGEGLRRLLSMVALGALLLLSFSAVHPALNVMTSPPMAVLGMVVFVLFALTAGVLADETQKAMKEAAYRLLGAHAVEYGRLGLAATSFTVAIEGMRKRRARTLLTLVTLVTVAVAVTSLTSISPYVGVEEVVVGRAPAYSGLLLKSGLGVPPLDVYHPTLAEMVSGIVGARGVVLPRAWYYPPSIGPRVGVYGLVTPEREFRGNQSYRVLAVLGMTGKDVEWTLGPYLTPGSRAFLEGETFACIVPDSLAKLLNVSVGDRVNFQGVSLLVVGVFNSSLLQLAANVTRDLDGLSIAPIDPHYVQQLGLGVLVPAQQVPPPVSWSSLLVVPLELALRMGGYVAAVSVRAPPGGPGALLEAGRLLALALDVPVYASKEGSVVRFSRYPTFVAFGWELIPVVLVIGALNVLVTLLGNLREKTKEIYVYSAVGLSPSGAVIMFLVETSVFAVLGAFVGYYLGFLLNRAFLQLGFLPPGFAFNYASLFTIISISVLLAAAMLTSLYPARVAASLITPSLERKWKPPTKPRGGVWEVPMPLSLPSLEEARGLVEFLQEYYEGAGAEKPSFRVVRVARPEPLRLQLEVALAPYELGMTQTAEIAAEYSKVENRYRVATVLKHVSGPEKMWASYAYFFIDDLRKQLLLWRALSAEERQRYIRGRQKP
jgi:hypothetical protein